LILKENSKRHIERDFKSYYNQQRYLKSILAIINTVNHCRLFSKSAMKNEIGGIMSAANESLK
jgi:hypothetical protein